MPSFSAGVDKACEKGRVYTYSTSRKALARTKEYPLEVPNETSMANLLLGANCNKP